MQDTQLNQISNFIWNTADSVLRDIFVRGKYRDVILPMTVIRRLDAVLEPTKEAVLEEKKWLDENGIIDHTEPLTKITGQQFYNSSDFTLRSLRNTNAQQQLRQNFEAYLDGYSPNVQEILDKFEFRNQISRLSNSNGLDALIERYLTRDINFGPEPTLNEDDSVRLPGLDNHAMGTIFEDLIRRFNEDNNEEAGEHWTPRDAVELMARLVLIPVQDQIESGTYLLYDGALVLQRRFKEGCPRRHEARLGAWHESGWPVRYCPAYPPATAATLQVRTVPGAASHALPGTLGAGLSGASFPPQACCRLRRKAPPSRHRATW